MGEDGAETPGPAHDLDDGQGNGSATVASEYPIEEVAVEDGGGDLEDNLLPPTPRFLQDESLGKNRRRIPYAVRRLAKAAVRWSGGPANPRDYKIEPLLPAVQHAPLWLLDRYLPRRRHRTWLVIGYAAAWLVVFTVVLFQGRVATEIDGFGEPRDIGCGSTYWLSGNQCGLDGNDCRPFNGTSFAFKCPAECANYMVLNPRAVGDREVIYQPLVVGGPPAKDSDADPVYRGDSFICGSAIHAGVIDNSKGGCGIVSVIGERSGFVGSARRGIESVGFESYFPLSFTFESGIKCESRDMRWPLLAVSVVFTVFLSVFTTSPALFFFGSFVCIFWTTGLATDAPPYFSIAELVSKVVGRFLPAAFVAWVMFDKMGARRALDGLTAQIEKAVLWLGACWVGALTNYTFDFIPIQRLTPHDLKQQPGAWSALSVIVIVLVAITITQVWFFRQEGRLVAYLKLYALFAGGLVVCVVLPDLNLRVHHYVLALLLLPGTSMQTRPSLLYQGLLMGFFINGIARWGFDPVLQTSLELRGDGQLGSPLPKIHPPNITTGANLSTITFTWQAPPGPRYDGVSILVNDVERFRGFFNDFPGSADNFTWTRRGDREIDEYFRFALMEGSQSDDYTKAGVWNGRGEWEEMASGPSRVKSRSLDGEERLLMR